MTSSQIPKELENYQSIRTVLIALRDQIGLSERDIARATQSHERSVRRWIAGDDPGPAKSEKIDDLRSIVSSLGKTLPASGIIAWLRNRNRNLDEQRPIDVLPREDGFDKVWTAVRAFKAGDFA